MAKTDYKSVDDYIAAQHPPTQPVLERVRAAIRKALPRATEGISYQIPVYKVDGQMVLYGAGYQHHYSLYPATEQLMKALGKDAAGLLHSKATLRFSMSAQVPTGLIARIAKARVGEAVEVAATKASESLAKKASKKVAAKKPQRALTKKRHSVTAKQ